MRGSSPRMTLWSLGSSEAARAPSERPGPAQLPVLLPSGQVAVAELERDTGVGRIEAGNAGRAGRKIDFRAAPARMIDQRLAERRRGLIRRHAEDERKRVRARRPAPREP